MRLLAFVPTIAGAAVGLISGRPPAVDVLAIGVLWPGHETVGILVYELRNSHAERQRDEMERMDEQRVAAIKTDTDRLTRLHEANTDLTRQDKDLTEQVADLTKQIHALLAAR